MILAYYLKCILEELKYMDNFLLNKVFFIKEIAYLVNIASFLKRLKLFVQASSFKIKNAVLQSVIVFDHYL